MFKSMEELVHQAENRQIPIYDIMLEQEQEQTGHSLTEIMDQMSYHFQVMKDAAHKGITGVRSLSGLSGFDAKRLYEYLQSGKSIVGNTFLKSVCYAIAVNEVNASMGIICATPTAGSCGVLPGVMLAMQEHLQVSDEVVVKHLFTASAVGFVIANNASISGAEGGCQAEVGSASAMAAAAMVEMAGGSPSQVANAVAIALKNMLGLVCDPVAGLVEIPCIKRNAAGASNALTAAEMSLAGIQSFIPADEVIHAMLQVGKSIPFSLRETAMGGLATTPTGIAATMQLNVEYLQEDESVQR